MFSIDVNGLKTVNDTKDYAAGDELIKGAADCLALTIKSGGKIYRTGGDEFMAIAHTNEPEKIKEDIKKKPAEAGRMVLQSHRMELKGISKNSF